MIGRILLISAVLLPAVTLQVWGIDGKVHGEAASCTLSCSASAAPDAGIAPLTVSFSAEAIPSDCAGAVAYNWEFGDGNLSGAQNPGHTYNSVGTFTWVMTAWVEGVSCSQTGTITVDPPPVCTLTCSATVSADSGAAPLAVSFGADAMPTNCTGAVAFNWDFGDGALSGEQNPLHTYDEPGTFAWILNVWVDGINCSETGTVQVQTAEFLPGDCDGNGTVTIGEVQRVIRMHLRLDPPGCRADCDSDGVVTIGEVQKAIRAHLRMPVTC